MTLETPNPSFEKMWKFIGERLGPRGRMPDKASLDYKQAFELYSILLAEDMMFREMAQIVILRKETKILKNIQN